MKKNLHFYLSASILLLSLFCHAQPLYTKTLFGAGPLTIGSEIMLPTIDNAILYFGSLQANKSTVSKIDSTGIIKWSRTYDLSSFVGSDNSKFIDAANSPDSTFAAVGTMSVNSGFYGHGFCIKFKANGDTMWCRQLNKSPYVNLIPLSISTTLDSGFVISGAALLSYTVSGAWQHSFIAKITKTGVLSWLNTYSNSYNDNVASTVRQCNDSGFIAIGGIENNGVMLWCTTLMKIDKTGHTVWSKKYCDASTDYEIGLDIIPEKNDYKCLISSAAPCLLSIDTSGAIIWVKSYHTISPSISEEFKRDMNLRKTSDQGNLIVGNSGNWVIKTDSFGSVKWFANPSLTNIDAVEYKNKNIAIIGNPEQIIVRSSPPLIYNNVGLIITDSLGSSSSFCYSTHSVNMIYLPLDTISVNFTTIPGGSLSALNLTLSTYNLISTNRCLEEPTGIAENTPHETKIFPNPNRGQFTIESDNLKGKEILFEIKDQLGRNLFNQKYNVQTNSIEPDISHLSDGVYFYSISSNGELIKSGKICVSRSN